MKEVTQKEFYALIGPMDVILRVVGNFPYTTEFRLRNGGLLKGMSIDGVNDGEGEHIITKYLIA